MEGSLVFLDQVTGADKGSFKVIDILGFPVATFNLEVQRKEGGRGERREQCPQINSQICSGFLFFIIVMS